MAYNNKGNKLGNNRPDGFGVGPYDHFSCDYDSQGECTDIWYYRGGQQDAGTLVAHIQFTYDSSGNLESATRVS